MSEETWVVEAWSALANLILAGAAVAASLAAFQGLNTWKNQVKWQQDHELAKRILTSTFRYRDAFQAARSPWFPAWEMIDNDEVPTFGESEEVSYKKKLRAHQRRIEAFLSLKPSIYADLIEAEVLWGTKIRGLWHKALVLESSYLDEFQKYARTSHSKIRGERVAIDGSEDDRLRSYQIVFHDSTTTDDFGQEFQCAIEELSAYLKERVGRKSP